MLQMGERVRKTVGVSGMVEEGKDSFLLLLSRLASGRRNEREAAVALLAYLFTVFSLFYINVLNIVCSRRVHSLSSVNPSHWIDWHQLLSSTVRLFTLFSNSYFL